MDPQAVLPNWVIPAVAVGIFVFLWFLSGLRRIRPDSVGLVERVVFGKPLAQGQLIAMKGECGYQAALLQPGLPWIPRWIMGVRRMPLVQIGPDEKGLVVAQVGLPLEQGLRTSPYKEEFGNFEDVGIFLRNGGVKGKQRIVLRPGTYKIHPVAFLVLTPHGVYGTPMDPDLRRKADKGTLSLEDFDLTEADLRPNIIKRRASSDAQRLQEEMEDSERQDPRSRKTPGALGGSSIEAPRRERLIQMMGIITTQEGLALEKGQLAGRLQGWDDIEAEPDPKKRINLLLENQNRKHKAYQNFDAFLANGGQAGPQHDPVSEGTYYFNPWCVTVEEAPVLHVMEGEVAVIKARVGLAEKDISGIEFRFGTIVNPGHCGLWSEPIRTGSWFFNPRCYEPTLVPTKILTLYWADEQNAAGVLDKDLKTIKAKSKDGFTFSLELQVQIHISDVSAPRVISMVGSVQNLVNEVLQSAVGNYFRNKVQSMEATQFIQERDKVQEEALTYIREKLSLYEVQTLGIFLQDIAFPDDLAEILRNRELATQEVQTFERQKDAQEKRVLMEAETGRADKQKELVGSSIGIEIASNKASARKAEADGEAEYISKTGTARAAEVRAVGLAQAEFFERQVEALGREATAVVNIVQAISRSGLKVMPDVLVTGGGGAVEGLAATLMKTFGGGPKGDGATRPFSGPVEPEAKPRAAEPEAKPMAVGPGPISHEPGMIAMAPVAPVIPQAYAPSESSGQPRRRERAGS